MGIDHASAMKGFIRFFKEHPPTFAAKADSTSMKVGGRSYHYDDLNSLDKLLDAKKILDYDLVEWHRAAPEDRVAFMVDFVEATYRKEVLDQKRAKAELKERLRGNGKSELALPDVDYILTHLQTYRVLGDTRKEAGYRFWDTKTDRPTPYDYHSVYASLRSATVDKDVIEQFLTQILHVQECYNPHGSYGLTLMPATNAVYLANQYVPPEWRTLDVEPELPEEIDRLMAHLFPKDECREFVYTWIYHSLTSRAGTYLYLCGGQGSGKNSLANIVAALHGAGNTSNPKQDGIHGRFNQFLKNRSFVFFDEYNCRTRQDKDTLKRIINERVQIEAKNKDHEDIDIHASYFIANNSLEALGLEPTDRRFSVPDVTHAAILPALGANFVSDLMVKLKDHAYVARLGRWILANFREPKWGPEVPYQRSRFEEIVLATARSGIAEIVAKTLRGEQNDYDYYEERESFKRTHRGQPYPSLLDWLKFFREARKDGAPLGVVEGTKFLPAEPYRVKGGGL